MKDPKAVAELIKSIQEKRAEQDIWLKTLILWTEVENQGIDSDNVKSFTFDESLITPLRMRELRRQYRGTAFGFGTQDHVFFRWLGKHFYNKINLKNGESVELYPMLNRPH